MKQNDKIMVVKVGEGYIDQEQVAELLGVMVDEILGWKEQVPGKGGIISQPYQSSHPSFAKNSKNCLLLSLVILHLSF